MTPRPRSIAVPQVWRVLDARHRDWTLTADFAPITGVPQITITAPHVTEPMTFNNDAALAIVGAFLEARDQGAPGVLGDEPGVSVLRTAVSQARLGTGTPPLLPSPRRAVQFVPGLFGEVPRA